jgi:hypothetical protein
MTDDSRKAAKEISDYVTHALMAFGEETGRRFDAVEAALAFTNLLGKHWRNFRQISAGNVLPGSSTISVG